MITGKLIDRKMRLTRLLCLPEGASSSNKLLLVAVLGIVGALTACADAHLPLLTSIQVSPANSSIDIGQTQQFTAQGTFSDGSTKDLTNLVTWSSSNTTVATINASGLALGQSQGSSMISALFNTADGPVTGAASLGVIVTLKSLTITPVNPSIANGTSLQLTATGIFSDGSTQNLTASVSWTSLSNAIATVSSSGLVKGTAVGNTTITATQAGVSATTTVTVTAAALTSIDITPANSSIAAGTSEQLKATGNFSDGTTQDLTAFVTWASSAPPVTVSNAAGSQGLVMGTGAGSATITATLGGVSGATTVTVTPAVMTSIRVIPANPSIPNGTTVQLRAIGTFSDGTTQNLTTQVSWTSSSGTIATVDNTVNLGLVTGKAVGSAPITATLGGVSGATTVTVTDAVLTSITIKPASSSIANGTSEQLVAIGNFSDGSTQNLTRSVTWSSDSTLAVVSNAAGSQGLVTGNGVGGPVTISASLPTVPGVTGSATVTVTHAIVTSIQVHPADQSIVKGDNKLFRATGIFSDGTKQDITATASWISSDSTIATVGSTGNLPGLVTGTGVGGPITITATQDGVSGSASVTVAAPPEFAYVTNDTDNTVTVFSVDNNTGALTTVGAPVPNPGTGAASVTADPSGKFLYTANQFGSNANNVTAYSITQSGPNRSELTLIDTFPAGAGAFSVAVEPSGHFAYVGNVGANTISGFMIDPSTGALTPVPGSPFSAAPATGAQGIATHPNDQLVYVSDSGTNNVGVFTFDHTSGMLNLPGTLFGPPSGTISDPVSITLDPMGRFAYTANNRPSTCCPNGSVTAYTVDPNTGALTFVNNYPVGTSAGGPAMVAIDPTGSFAYVAGGGQVAAFNIDSTTGALTAIPGSPFTAALNTLWVAVDPNGKFVYVTDHGSFGSGTTPGGISAYAIDPITGALTEIPGSPFPLPKGPTSITLVAVP